MVKTSFACCCCVEQQSKRERRTTFTRGNMLAMEWEWKKEKKEDLSYSWLGSLTTSRDCCSPLIIVYIKSSLPLFRGCYLAHFFSFSLSPHPKGHNSNTNLFRFPSNDSSHFTLKLRTCARYFNRGMPFTPVSTPYFGVFVVEENSHGHVSYEVQLETSLQYRENGCRLPRGPLFSLQFQIAIFEKKIN